MAECNAASRPGILPDLTTLLAAMVLLMFSNGRFPVAVCSWLGPLLMIHFTRGGKGLVRLPLAYLGLSFAFGYQFYEMTPFGGSAYLLFCASFGITLLLPYVSDRYVGQRRNGLNRSLVFPLALVTSEYLASFGPFWNLGFHRLLAVRESDAAPIA
jgi:apolipoprotein N-acyltransferase